MVLQDTVLISKTFVWILNHVSRSIYEKLVSVRPKSIKIGQMTTLSAIFHMVVSVY